MKTEGIYFSGEQPDKGTEGPKVEIAYCVEEGPARGRPSSLSEEKLAQLMELYYSKPYSLRRLADILGVSRMTVWRAVQNVQVTI